MRALWTVAKVVLALALAIPVLIIVLGTALGILGVLVSLAIMAIKLAVVGLIAWGVFKLAVALMGGRKRHAQPAAVPQLPPVDPYYEAAERELDRELGHVSR
jgi:hypothetical protein